MDGKLTALFKNEPNEQQAERESLLTERLKQWYRQDIEHVLVWRRKAKEDYAFYNGEQWADEDLALLAEQKRPVMTFNRIAPLVNAIVGSEINNRRQVQYIPRQVGESIADEILTGAGEWFRTQSYAEDEESEAFADAVITGMGWVDTRLDFENDPDGAPIVQRLDPFKMVWDAASTKPNLTDAQRLWYIEQKPVQQLQEMFPDVHVSDLHADWAGGPASSDSSHNADNFYSENKNGNTASTEETATLVECRWFEREPYYRAADLITGEQRDFGEDEFKNILARFPDYPHLRQYRKIVKRAFIGRKILALPDQPLVPSGHLGWECITGYFDKLAGQFYGIVRSTKDPQRWSNKFFSQIMYILNSQSKGGILAERGAFDDDRQAEESLARADQITWTKNGALSSTNARIQSKPMAQFPNGFFTLFNETKNALTQVTGLSPEFLGTREINQPGVLETQRRQSSLNLLASLFNALRRYRKRQGRMMLYLIQNYLSDGRLVKIIGSDKEQYIPLTREVCAQSDYDIIVDDAPTSPNEKERNFAVIQQMLPFLKEYMTPEMVIEILKYSPLPASLVDKWSKKIIQNPTPMNS